MALIRTTSISFIVLTTIILLLGCKQQPASESSPQPVYNAAEADWARIDLYEEDSVIKGFIDMKTYQPMGTLTVNFWHRLTSDNGETITHLLLDCQEKRYKVLARLIYDNNGTLLDQTTEQSDWKNFTRDSNIEGLCLTLAPMDDVIIPTRDLPIIRELLLKGLKRVR